MSEMELAQWRQVLARHFAPLRTGGADEFVAEFDAHPVGQVEVYRVDTTAHFLERSPDVIGESAPRDVKVYLLLEGRAHISQGTGEDARDCELAPGDATLFVTHRPYAVRFPGPQSGILLKFPASILPIPVGAVEELATVVLRADNDIGGIVKPGLKALLREDHGLSAHAVELLLELLLEGFLQAARGDEGDTLVQEAAAYIEEHLNDGNLGPQEIAAAVFVSPRYLQKRFAAAGLTVSGFVRSRRLHHVRRDLANPALAELSILEVAGRYGITDPSHLSRSFKREFGLTPTQFRSHAGGRAAG